MPYLCSLMYRETFYFWNKNNECDLISVLCACDQYYMQPQLQDLLLITSPITSGLQAVKTFSLSPGSNKVEVLVSTILLYSHLSNFKTLETSFSPGLLAECFSMWGINEEKKQTQSQSLEVEPRFLATVTLAMSTCHTLRYTWPSMTK